MELEPANSPRNANKRAAERSPSEAGDERESKKPKTDHVTAPSAPVAVKRDRENATVLVAGLPPSATEDDLRKLFRDVSMRALLYA